MNLSSYAEEIYNNLVKETPEVKAVPVVQEPGAPVELTPEENERAFWDFDKEKNFIGTFDGPGQTYSWTDDNKNTHLIKTWALKDENSLPWFIPQWAVLDRVQSNFEGFTKEIPGECKYQITYLGKNENGHNIAIFKRKL